MPDWKTVVREQFGDRTPDDDVLDELAQHAEDLYAASIASGQSPEASSRAVLRQLARLPATMPDARRSRPESTLPAAQGRLAPLRIFAMDLRHGVRLLAARPMFSLIAILTLALGIGANTAVFSVVNGLLIQPLPFPDPERLVMLWEHETDTPQNPFIVSKPNYEDWAAHTTSFERSAIWEFQSFNVGGDGEPEQVSGMRVSSSMFPMIGVPPVLGRTFTPEEDRPGHDVAVISHRLWTTRYGARPDIVGHRIRLNGRPFAIVGVMPGDFNFTRPADGIWVPIHFTAQDARRDSHSFFAAARLKRGVTLESAKAELAALGRQLAEQHRENSGEGATLTRMDQYGIGPGLRSTLLTLLGCVGLVLLIACANVANLLLAQASTREREFAIRAALGAGRLRIGSQMLAEGLILAMAGGLAAVGAAYAGTSLLDTSLPPAVRLAPFREPAALAVDVVVLGFTFAVSLLTGLLFSVLPAVVSARAAAAGSLKATDSRTGSTGPALARSCLVALEISLAIVVLAGAGLTIKSMGRLLRVDPGLDPANVITMQVALPQNDFYGPPQRQTFCRDIAREVAALPGVLSVGAVSHLPLTGANAGRGLILEGRESEAEDTPGAGYRLSCPGYFQTLGIPIVGRDFTDADSAASEQVVIVNQAAADRYWPGQAAVGKRFKLSVNPADPWMTVVGVVGNVRHFGLDSATGREIFRPYSQAAWPVMTITAKTATEPALLSPAVRGAVRRADPEAPVSNVRPMDAVLQASVGPRRFPMLLLGAFAAIALLLAVIGVYGVVSYVVSQRRKEIGIRIALGAGRRTVTVHVMRRSMIPVVLGLAAGLAGAMAASRLLESVLYEVQPRDPAVLGSIAVILGAAALAASWLPARRAASVEPLEVLRESL